VRGGAAFGWVGLACASVACANGPSTSGAPQTDDGGDDAPLVNGPPVCTPSTFALVGPPSAPPHGLWAMTGVALTGSSMHGDLAGGGSVDLAWTGDATAGDVPVTGKVQLPTPEAGALDDWCIDGASTLHLSGGKGTLALRAAEGSGVDSAPGGACVLVAEGDASSDPAPLVAVSGCFDAEPP